MQILDAHVHEPEFIGRTCEDLYIRQVVFCPPKKFKRPAPNRVYFRPVLFVLALVQCELEDRFS